MRRFVIKGLAAVALCIGIVASMGSSVSAKAPACESDHFMGLRAWYDGLYLQNATGETNSDGSARYSSDSCVIQSPPKDNPDELKRYVWTIVFNIISMVLGIVGYLAIGFVMYGGIQYVLSQGDVTRATRAKKTITNSIVGLAIVMSASIISGAISDIISEAKSSGNFVTSIFNQVFLWGGILTVIMIIWGGLQYIFSAGNTSAITKAKSTILYSAIGLVIILFAAAIVNFVVGAL